MNPITSQKHGGALIRAGALNGDNTVTTNADWYNTLIEKIAGLRMTLDE